MPKAHRPKQSDANPPQKSEVTNPKTPDREDIEAEIPQAPAQEPSAEPTAIGRPRPTVEPERE